MKRIKNILPVLFVLFLQTAIASKDISVFGSDWDDPRSWASGKVPGKPDTIVINHYISFSHNLVISAPTVLIIENGGTLCGDYLLDIECGASFLNRGSAYINTFIVRDGINFNELITSFMAVTGCTVPGNNGGFKNMPPNGQMSVLPTMFCKSEDKTGLNTILQQQIIQITPNPINSGVLKIEGHNIQEVKLYNLNGRLIYQAINEQIILIDMKDLPPGMYVVAINSENKNIFRKILKQ